MPSAVAATVTFLKTVGLAVGGLSISAGQALAIGAATVVAGAVAASKLIAELYKVPSIDSDRSRQATVRGTVEPQKLIYGEALVSGPISFVGVAGTDNRDLYHAIVLAGHPSDSISDIYFDDERIASGHINAAGNVTTGTFGPKDGTTICVIRKLTGSQTTADSVLDGAFSTINSAEHIGTNLTYIATKFTLTEDSQETWDKFMPNDIKALVKGKKVYDPRQDSTSDYYDATVGVATQRANDSSTWKWSENPVWCLVDYLTDDRFGMDIDLDRIDLSKAADAADICDATVSVPGGSEKRYTCNGVIFGTATHKVNINKLLSSMNGMLTYTNGKYVIRAGAFEAVGSGMTLTEDNMIGPVKLKTSFERGERFNTITGTFVDPSKNYKEIEFPKVQITSALTRDNNEELVQELKLSMTNSRYMAQRIAHKLIQLSDLQKVLTFPTNLAGVNISVGDRVNVTLSEFGYTNKTFVCLGWTLSESGTGGVNLTLREDDSSSYADLAQSGYSTVTPAGGIQQGFFGVPDPSGLSATAHVESIELDWTNPANMTGIIAIEVFASPDSSWSNAVKIGETIGTQFIHDESNGADSISEGDQRYYWVRARRFPAGEGTDAVSDRNPDSDTSTVQATKGALGALSGLDTVGDSQIDDNAVTNRTIADDAVDTDQIANDAVNNDHLADNSVNTEQIVNNAITTTTISDDAITTAKIAANAVTANEIAANTITATEIAANTITASQIATDTITASEIAAGAIDTTELAADAVTTAKIAADAVTATEINVTSLDDISADAGTITGGSVGGISITSTKLYAGTGDWANTNTGFYLDNTGKFSLKDKFFYNPSNNLLTVDGNITADVITAKENLVVLGDLEASSMAAGSITRAMFSQDALDEIYGALATSVGGSNGDYKEASGSFTTSGGTVTVGTSSDKFDHGTADVVVEFLANHYFYTTTNYTTAQAQATLNFEVSADGTFTDLTSATKTETLQFGEYDLSSYYGYTYLVYFFNGEHSKTFTTGSGNDIPDSTELQFRVRVTGVGTAFTSQTVPFTVEANEGVTGVVSTGGNADTLDNLDSTKFLRSDVDDTFDADLTITGDLSLQGALNITGDINSYNVTDLDVTDKTITVNSGNTQALSNGAGLIVDRGTAADASITWDETDDTFDFSHSIALAGNGVYGIQVLDGIGGSGWLEFNEDDDGVWPTGTTDNITVLGSVTHMVFAGDSNANGTGGLFYWGYGQGRQGGGTFTKTMDLDRSGNLTTTGTVTWSGGGSANANTAYGWGDHSAAGYLTSYTETDTLATVTGRGATTTNAINVGGVTSSGRLVINDDTGGDASWTGGILIDNSGSDAGEPAIAFQNSSMGANYWIVGSNQDNELHFSYGTTFQDGNTKLNLKSDGKLGVGTGAAGLSYMFNVTGTSYLNGGVGVSATPSSSYDLVVGEHLNISSGHLYLDGTVRINENGNATLGVINSGQITSSGSVTAGNASTSLGFYVGTTQVIQGSTRNLVNIGTISSGAITSSGRVYGTEFDLPSGGMLDWANGDARIVEGLVNNYSLSFQTYDGSNVTTALRLDGNNAANFSGTISSGAITSSGTVTWSGGSSTEANTAYDKKINSISFAAGSGLLTLTRQDSTVATTNLDGRYLTSYTETDTLDSVTDRGATTTNAISVGSLTAAGSNNVYAATFTGATGPSVTSLGLNVKTLDGANDVALLVEKTDGTDLFKITGQGVGSFSQRITVQNQDITGTRIQNWQTAYGWGDHSTAGYLTSYTETDTLDSVTGRGATTTNAISTGAITSSGNSSFSGKVGIGTSSFTNAINSNALVVGSAFINSSAQLFVDGFSRFNGPLYLSQASTPANYVGLSYINNRLTLTDNADATAAIDAPDGFYVDNEVVISAGRNITGEKFTTGTDAADGIFVGSTQILNASLRELQSINRIGIKTNDPATFLHLQATSTGAAKSTYGVAIVEAEDAHFEITSTSAGTWGSSILLREAHSSAYRNAWAISRKTGTAPDLVFNFGTVNDHNINGTKFTFASNGDFTAAGSITSGSHTINDGKLVVDVAGAGGLGTQTFAIELKNTNDSAYDSDALTAYNATTGWDINDRVTYMASSRANAGSIYTYMSDQGTEAVAVERIVQLDSANTNSTGMRSMLFYQYDGAGTSNLDFKSSPSGSLLVIGYYGGSAGNQYPFKFKADRLEAPRYCVGTNTVIDDQRNATFANVHVNNTANLQDGTNPDISANTIYGGTKIVTPKLVFLNDGAGDDNYITHTDANNAFTVNGNEAGAWFSFIGDKLTDPLTAASSGLVASYFKGTEIELSGQIRASSFGVGIDDPYYLVDARFNNTATSLSGGGSGNWGGNGIRIENTNATAGTLALAHFRVGDADWHIGAERVGTDNANFLFMHEGSTKVSIDSNGAITSNGYSVLTSGSQITTAGAIVAGDSSSALGYYVGANQVIDGNRALKNIVSINSGAITTSGTITLNGADPLLKKGTYDYLDFDDDSASYGTGTNATVLASISDLVLRTNTNDGGGGLFRISTGGSTPTSLLDITTAGNATFNGTISSGAITSTGSSSFGDVAIGGAADSNYDLKVYGLARFQGVANFINNVQVGGTTVIDSSRNITSIKSVELEAYTPPTTTNKLYNVAGTLYWNGQSVATSTSIGVLRANDGSASAPSYSFASDTNTGMYSDIDDGIRWAVGGQAKMSLTGTGLGVTGTVGASTGYKLLLTQWMDSNLNISNIGTIDSGKITAPNIDLEESGSTRAEVRFIDTDAAVNFALRLNGENLDFYEPEDADKLHVRIVDDNGLNAVFGLRTGAGDGTTRIDGSGNATFGTITHTGDYKQELGANSAPSSTDVFYIGGDNLGGTDASMYIGNRGDGTGYGWRLYYHGSGGGNLNDLSIQSENLGSPVNVLRFNQDGAATFANSITASGYISSSGAVTAGNGSTSLGYYVGSTQVIQGSTRNLVNIGTISSGAITTSSTVTADRMGYNAGNYAYLSQTSSGATTVLGHNVRAHASVNNRADTVNGSWHGHAIAMYYDRGISFYTTSSTVAAGTTIFSSNTDTTNLRMRIAPNGNFDFRGGAFSNVGGITSSGNITAAGNTVSAEVGKFNASGTTASACKLHVGAIQDSGSSAIAQFGGFIRLGGALILHNGSASANQTHIEFSSNDISFRTATGSATGVIQTNGYKIGTVSTPVITSSRDFNGVNANFSGNINLNTVGQKLNLGTNVGTAAYIRHGDDDDNVGSVSIGSDNNIDFVETDNGTRRFRFETNNGNSRQEGNHTIVGNLIVHSGAETAGTAKIRSLSNAGDPALEFSDNGGDQHWVIGADDRGTGGFFTVRYNASTAFPDDWTSNGSMCFEIDGNSANNDIVFNGNVTAYSDIRIKENIEQIPDALSKVHAIRGITYDRINSDDGRRTGVIAQEVEAVLPEVVREGSDGIKSVDYGNMVGLLIEAIKEQSAQIQTLNQRIEELENGNHKDD